MQKRNIAIADIHGFLKTFDKCLEKIEFNRNDHLFILGDMVGRGPNQAGLLDRIMDLIAQGYNITCLLGNHENWLLNDVAHARKNLNSKYLDFIKSMEFYHASEDFILVHAGFNIYIPFPPDDKKSMLEVFGWERSNKKNLWIGDRKVLFGHSVRSESVIQESIRKRNQYIGLDNGIFIEKTGYGNMCAYDFTNNQLYFQENAD